MPFVYRLQKILNFRIQKKKEQEEIVKAAEREVIRIQNEIDAHKQNIDSLTKTMFSSPHTMMQNYDDYIKHLYDEIDKLEEQKQEAIKKLQEEREKLAELERGVKVLEKHKEKAHEEYKHEEKRIELKLMDEVAGQKHYQKTQEKILEEIEEGLNQDEY